MNKRKIYYELKNIGLKTVLIYPPVYEESKDYAFPHLGIPRLQGYLMKNKGYKRLEAIDFNRIYNTKIDDINIKRILTALKNFFDFLSTKKARNLTQQFSTKQSLNQILHSIMKNEFSEKEKKKMQRYVTALIKSKTPDIIGISVIYPSQIFYSLFISKIIKEIKEDIFIVLGGTQITKHIKYLTKKTELTKIVDAFIIGDGEEPLVHLIYHLNKNRNLKKVPNLYLKTLNLENGPAYTRSNTVYYYNPKTSSVLPDFSGFRINNVLPIVASVGCHWGKCTFCTYKLFHKKNVCSKPEKVVNLIKSLIRKYKVNEFWFVDDSLTTEFLQRFSKIILTKKLKIRWNATLCFQSELLNESLIRMLAKSGCKTIKFGLESMSPRILKLMNKPQQGNLELVISILKLFKQYKIKTILNVIFGFPSETKEEARMTLDFLINKKELYSLVYLQQFVLEDNTFILEKFDKFGISKIYTDDKDCGIRLGFHYETYNGMSMQESKEFIEEANRILNKNRRKNHLKNLFFHS